jgi:hypothetical protein
MFEGWGNFYFLLGSASASLIGLMFVVTTLTRGSERRQVERGQRLFMTPTVFNFAAVLTLSAVALAPRLDPGLQRDALGLLGGYGLGYALVIVWQGGRAALREKLMSHWSDLWCYGLIPLALYAAFEGSVVATGFAHEYGCYGVALSLLAILLIAVRNAWDLVTWMAPRSN